MRLGAGAFLAGNSMALSLAINVSDASVSERRLIHLILAVAAGVVAVVVGGPLAKATVTSLRAHKLGVEGLFVVALLGATGLSTISAWRAQGPVYFEVISLLLVIFAWGQQFKQTSQQRLMLALRQQVPMGERYSRIDPATGVATLCLRSEIKTGDHIRLAAGDFVPADSLIVDGRAFINTAAMTGEGLCVARHEGQCLQAGMQIIDAPLRICAQSTAPNSQIDMMSRDILAGMAHLASSERMAERWVERLLPIVMAVSAATFFYWSIAASASQGLMHAMAVLLVACPCALSFATPTALWAGAIGLARLGLYTRSTAAIERLAQIDTLIFDKTGTLTDFTPRVDRWIFNERCSLEPGVVVALAAAAQRLSAHPIATAFHRPVGDAVGDIVPKASRLHPGVGLTVTLQHNCRVWDIFLGEPGTHLTAAQKQVWQKLHQQLDPALRAVCVAVDGIVAAAAGICDHIVVDASRLRLQASKLGISMRICSGDAQGRVDLLHQHQARGNMSPSDKQQEVLDLQQAGRKICFTGDGINDALAMSSSHVSMAIDTGAMLATSVADFILPRGQVYQIVEAVALARRVHRLIKSNLTIALTYNAIAMAVAAVGLIHPVFAAVVMLASSLTVTLRVARYLS